MTSFATRPDLSDRGRWLAVHGILSHLCAAALWALILPPPFIEVIVPRGGGRRRDRIEVTTLARTLDDIAPRLTEHALHQAVRLEAAFYVLCVRAGLPRLTKQRWIGHKRRVAFLFSVTMA